MQVAAEQARAAEPRIKGRLEAPLNKRAPPAGCEWASTRIEDHERREVAREVLGFRIQDPSCTLVSDRYSEDACSRDAVPPLNGSDGQGWCGQVEGRAYLRSTSGSIRVKVNEAAASGTSMGERSVTASGIREASHVATCAGSASPDMTTSNRPPMARAP